MGNAMRPDRCRTHAWLDGDVAISSHSADAKAAAFVAYITRPAAAPVWKANGLDRP
jgi:hypothetical protein